MPKVAKKLIFMYWAFPKELHEGFLSFASFLFDPDHYVVKIRGDLDILIKG